MAVMSAAVMRTVGAELAAGDGVPKLSTFATLLVAEVAAVLEVRLVCGSASQNSKEYAGTGARRWSRRTGSTVDRKAKKEMPSGRVAGSWVIAATTGVP